MADNNYLSFAGDAAGNIYRQLGGSPAELIFTADQPGMREWHEPEIVAPGGTADALKLSGVVRFRLHVGLLDGRNAAEDAVDINHCRDVELVVRDLFPGAKYCGTIKGASNGILINVEKQFGHGGETDWDYGNFSDQGNGKTTGCELASATQDGSAVRVRVLTADRPRLIDRGTPYKVDERAQGWFYPIYNFIKDILRTFGIKI